MDLVLPLQCLGCGKEEVAALCQACTSSLRRLEPPYCAICAQPATGSPCLRCADSPLSIDGIRAPYLMEGPVREAIHSLKYGNFRAIAPDLGRLLVDYLNSTPLPATLLAPVPMHSRRLRQRGYNQSYLLAVSSASRLASPWPMTSWLGPETRRLRYPWLTGRRGCVTSREASSAWAGPAGRPCCWWTTWPPREAPSRPAPKR